MTVLAGVALMVVLAVLADRNADHTCRICQRTYQGRPAYSYHRRHAHTE